MENIITQTHFRPVSLLTQYFLTPRLRRRAMAQFTTAESNLVAAGFSFESVDESTVEDSLDLPAGPSARHAAA